MKKYLLFVVFCLTCGNIDGELDGEAAMSAVQSVALAARHLRHTLRMASAASPTMPVPCWKNMQINDKYLSCLM